MARFLFSMQNILDIKEKLEEQEKNNYSQANLRLREAEEELEAIKARLAAATGIATNNIVIQAQQKPLYEAAEEGSFSDNISNYLMVLLTILIAGLLIFVIVRGTSPVEVTEMEPELSVEDLLATTQENEQNLEEIELGEKSETRVMIEKFVDENPEAVALLLRNWINEDWGGV